jgi:hypothetical protein
VHGPEVDLARFPRFADAECFTGVLEAGEMLFIPACWPHAFEHLGAINANVNFWWRPHWIELNPASLRQGLFDAILALSSDALESARTAAAPAAAGATADPRFLEVCQGLERACLAWRRSERRTRA